MRCADVSIRASSRYRVLLLHNSAVLGLIKDLGDPYQDIQTGLGLNYKDALYSNQYGIISKFDNTKKIWPVFQAKFQPPNAIFSLKDQDSTETLKMPITNINWNQVQEFDRAFFIKRLAQLK
jgi:hypothetical protein